MLVRYYGGELDAEEIAAVEAWMRESADNMKLAEQVYHICFAADAYMMKTTVDTDKAFAKVHRRIVAERIRSAFRHFERVAAVLILPFIGLAAYLAYDLSQEFNSVNEVRSAAGMVSCITLPDNSKVWLNSDSYLRYPSRFGRERRVTLYGEGYFEVSKDPKHKFIVEAKSSEVVVHGTEFNVESYDDEYVRTTLVSGVVDMCYDDQNHHRKALRLMPSQQAVYNTKTGLMHLSEENVRCNTSWKDGKIVLDNTSLDDALRLIGNKYNVRFIVREESHKHYKFTGTFSNQSLDVILRYFSMSSDINFRQVDILRSGEGASEGRSVYEVI